MQHFPSPSFHPIFSGITHLIHKTTHLINGIAILIRGIANLNYGISIPIHGMAILIHGIINPNHGNVILIHGKANLILKMALHIYETTNPISKSNNLNPKIPTP